jgi:two-component system sensor histidine kinase UhpB
MQTELGRLGRDVHDLSYQLHPSIVGELGLVTSLRTEIDRLRRQTGMRVENLIEDVDIRLSRDAALSLYRIAQETLHNALRHADATAISVALRNDKGSLVLEIRDNGKGFDVREASASGIGVSGMHERARVAGGTVQVTSQPGRGTAIIVNVPSRGTRHEQDQSTARG